MINVLIVDDEQHCINAVKDKLLPYKKYAICGMAKTVEDAVLITKLKQPKLVFLDIEIGTKTGFDYLKEFMPNLSFDVVFVTAYNQYAVKAFEFSALHYLLKPIDVDDFSVAISRLEEKITQEEYRERMLSLEHNLKLANENKFIHIKTTEFIGRVKTDDILYLKSDSNYTIFQMVNGKRIVSAKTLKYYTGLLKNHQFFRVNKSYLINVNEIKMYRRKSREILMNNGTVIIVAVRKLKDFLKNGLKD
jgi:two-component system LytT family response regulator